MYFACFNSKEYFYQSHFDCQYPRVYLLSIYGEEKDGEFVTTTTTTTTIPITILPSIGGFVANTVWRSH